MDGESQEETMRFRGEPGLEYALKFSKSLLHRDLKGTAEDSRVCKIVHTQSHLPIERASNHSLAGEITNPICKPPTKLHGTCA